MIKVNKEQLQSLRICDLAEGDIAVIAYHSYGDIDLEIVYVFRDGKDLRIVSLSHKERVWAKGSVSKNTTKVLHVFKPGETLTIA